MRTIKKFILTLPFLLILIPSFSNATAPSDWKSYFYRWSLDETSGARVQSGRVCSNCDLTISGSPSGDTTNKKQGTAAYSGVAGFGQKAICTDANCGGPTKFDMTGSYTLCSWIRPTSFAVEGGTSIRDWIGKSSFGSNSGYFLRTDADILKCGHGRGTGFTFASDPGTLSLNTYVHACCQFSAGSPGTLQLFKNGSAVGAPQTAANSTDNSSDFGISFSGNAIVGQEDLPILYDKVLSASEICRICSCDDDGSLCDCNGVSYNNTGRNASDCGSCTLPACNQPAPSAESPTPTPTTTVSPIPSATNTNTTATPTPTATPAPLSLYIKPGSFDSVGCGTALGSECSSYARLMGSVGCPNCGCDSNGCLDNINSATGQVNIHFVASANVNHGDGNNGCIGIGFNRASEAKRLTVKCVDDNGTLAPQQCFFDGLNVVPGVSDSLITIGADPTSCNATTTSYVTLKGVKVSDVVPGSYVLRLWGAVTHWRVEDNYFDGANTDSDTILAGTNADFGIFKNNTVINCGNGAYGCFGTQENDSVAIIKNTIGPNQNGYQDATVNSDTLTILNSTNVLVDGNTIKGPNTNCLDMGMVTGPVTQNVIARYNDIFDCGRIRGVSDWTSPLVKVSGNGGTGQSTQKVILYKNLLRYTGSANRNGGLWFTELTKDSEAWNNTINDVANDPGDGTRATMNLSSTSIGIAGLNAYYNLFTSSSASGCTAGQSCAVAIGGSGCSSTTCNFFTNLFYFPTLSSTGMVKYSTSDLGDLYFNENLARVGGGNGLNSTGSNTGNVVGDPKLTNIAAGTANGLKPTTLSSAIIDKAGSPLNAVGGATGTVITVDRDPRLFFPDPATYPELSASECSGGGIRGLESVDSHCFNIQIAGACGKKAYVALSATTITLDSSCTWSNGADIGFISTGSSTDIGAIEFNESGPTPTPTITVTPTVTVTPTPTITVTPTPTKTATPTVTVTITPTITVTPTPTVTSTPIPEGGCPAGMRAVGNSCGATPRPTATPH